MVKPFSTDFSSLRSFLFLDEIAACPFFGTRQYCSEREGRQRERERERERERKREREREREIWQRTYLKNVKRLVLDILALVSEQVHH